MKEEGTGTIVFSYEGRGDRKVYNVIMKGEGTGKFIM
jgi:hypothetical protein